MTKRDWTGSVLIIVLIAYIAIQKGCEPSKPDVVTVTTPAVSGSSETIYKPVPLPQPYPVYKYVTLKGDTIKVENPVNESLLQFYLANQSKRDSLYSDAIGEREYNIPVEDSLLITNNYIKAQGKVLEFQQTYTIKPRKISVTVPSNRFSLHGGFEVGNTIQLDNFAVKGNIGMRFGNGQISLGYDTNNTAWIGYNWTLIK